MIIRLMSDGQQRNSKVGGTEGRVSRAQAIGALVLACYCLIESPAAGQAPPARPDRSPTASAAQGDRQAVGRNRRGPVDVFKTQVPSRPFDIVLGTPTDTSVTASIVAYVPVEGYFEYGVDAAEFEQRTSLIQLAPRVATEVILNNLTRNTPHFYRWRSRAKSGSGFEASDVFSFRTGRTHGDAFVFTVQSDSHLDGRTDTRIYEASVQNAKEAAPDFHVDLGDTFMTDKRRSDYREALPQYLAQRYYLGLIGSVAPVFLVSGNHDGEARRRGSMGRWARAQREAYFATPSETSSGGGNYYSWEWGDTLLIALDPYWETGRARRRGDFWTRTLGTDQFRWLARKLESSRARHRFVFIHHLVGGLNQAARGGAKAARLFEWGGRGLSGSYEFDDMRPRWSMPIHRLLVETGVSVVFHGHDHAFAREELDGIAYVLVPQPGLDRYQAPREIDESYPDADIVGGPGHVRVSVDPDAALVELIQTRLGGAGAGNGRTAYSFEIRPR